MARSEYARLAGIGFLTYIAASFAGMNLWDEALNGGGIDAKLASIAQHASGVQLSALLMLFTVINALVLAVALYAITRGHNHDLAILALCFRVGEGVIGVVPVIAALGLLSLSSGAVETDGASAIALGSLLLKVYGSSSVVSATLFAAGSGIFAFLFLRARLVPVSLSWFGLLASILLMATLPLQLLGVIKGPAEWLIWMPMLVFEIVLALWLLIKGIAIPSDR